MRYFKFMIISFFLAGIFYFPTDGFSKQMEEYTLTIKDHRFIPEKLEVPAGEKVKLIVMNDDATPEEFESYELHREKIVTGKGKITVFIGPLKPGEYKYFGEFHQATAQGVIIAK